MCPPMTQARHLSNVYGVKGGKRGILMKSVRTSSKDTHLLNSIYLLRAIWSKFLLHNVFVYFFGVFCIQEILLYTAKKKVMTHYQTQNYSTLILPIFDIEHLWEHRVWHKKNPFSLRLIYTFIWTVDAMEKLWIWICKRQPRSDVCQNCYGIIGQFNDQYFLFF